VPQWIVSVIVVFAVCFAASSVAAQDRPSPTWRLDVGGALLIAPRYEGSDDMQLQPLPYVEAAYRDLLLATVRNGRARLDITPLRSGGFYAGVEAAVLFGQDETEARLPTGFGDIDAAPELGLVAGYRSRVWQMEARVRQAVSGHDGFTAEATAAVSVPIGRPRSGGGAPTILSIGPSLTYGDRSYAQTYFGIGPDRAIRTGLPAFEPGSYWSAGGSAVLVQPLWRNLSLVAVGSVSHLIGDSAGSPIVETKTNFSGVVAIAWRFSSNDR
jgi:MipA family protein